MVHASLAFIVTYPFRLNGGDALTLAHSFNVHNVTSGYFSTV